MGGDWTNNGGIFNENTGTVTFNGSVDQHIYGAESFYNLSFTNATGNLIMDNDLTIMGTLTMQGGELQLGTNTLFLGTDAANPGSLAYTSGIVTGKMQRWLTAGGSYLFPIGTTGSYKRINLTINTLSAADTVLTNFVSSDPGNSGLPLTEPDASATVNSQFTGGYWNFLATNGFATSDFSVELVANDFTSKQVNVNTRILRRDNDGAWTFDGTHSPASPPSVYRNNLTGGIASAGTGTQLGLGFVCALATITANITDAKCFGSSDGAINITVTNGTAPYSYSWINSSGSNIATTEDISGLAAGSYGVTVTDNNGCITPAIFTVNQPTAISSTETVTDVSCNGGNNGAIDITVSGGTPPYIYGWSTSDGSGLNPSDEDQTGLTAGTYTVLVLDANGCSFSKDIVVSEPSLITIDSESATDISCNGATDGVITVSASGGTGALTYTLNPGGISNGAGTFNGLSAVTYTVDVDDIHNCGPVTSNNLVVNEPSVITITSESSTNVTCNGLNNGTITITASGGTGTLTYTLNPGGSNNTTGVFTNLAPNTYNVSVSDVNGCGPVTSSNLTITEPPALTATISAQTNVSCNGLSNGDATVTAGGGTAPYTYLWSDGQTTATATGLAADNYNVTVTDANSCTTTASVTITEPAALAATASVTDVDCNGNANGAIDLTVTGGTTPYSFSWSNGATSEDLDSLITGSYTVTVTGNNGCTQTASLTLNEPNVIIISSAITNISCHGSNDGKIDITVNGGTSPFGYTWSTTDGSGLVSGEATQNALSAGNYTLTLNDVNGCEVSNTYKITEPEKLSMTATVTDAECPDMSNGFIRLSVAGGISPYDITWGNGMSGDYLSDLTADDYSVTVSDVNQCSLDTTITVGFIRSACLDIPTVITPNGDGHNDTWRIRNIELYPHARIDIFTRWGKRIFHSEEGYQHPWDGRYKGKLLPMDSYHYIIFLGNGTKPLRGDITIIR